MSRFDDISVERLRRRRTVKWSLHGPDVLAAWVAEMDFDVALPIRDALLEAVNREDFGYVEADTTELTTACTAFLLGRYGWSVPTARVFLVADMMAGIGGALDEFVPAATPVVLLTPSYPPLFEIIELSGRPVAPVPFLVDDAGRSTPDFDAIDAAFRAGARSLLLCNPQNPTGRVFTVEELSAIAGIVERHGARVISDEVHAPLVYPGHHHVPYASLSTATAAHTVTVTSASKAFNLAGLKCAQVVISNHDDAARWRTFPVLQVAGPTPIGIAASTAAYRLGTPWLDELIEYLDGNRRLLAQLVASEVPGVSLSLPEGTFLSWLDCSGLGVDDPTRFFLRGGAGRGLRRTAIRRGRRAARAVELRDLSRVARADRRRDGRRRQRSLISASVGTRGARSICVADSSYLRMCGGIDIADRAPMSKARFTISNVISRSPRSTS